MIKNKKVIGITSHYISGYPNSLGEYKLLLNEDYVTAIHRSQGVPLVLPALTDLSTIKYYATLINGLVLSGGDDVFPLHYGEEPSPKLMSTNLERDLFEIALIHEVMKQKKPILGICRGLQILNVALGGTLYQDIPSEAPGHLIQHRQQSREHLGSHSVRILPDSKLHQIFQKETLITNSFHHQAIKKLAPGLKATAFSKDDIIEAVEHPSESFVVAVQWHPECMIESDTHMLSLFTHFIKAVSSSVIGG